MLKTHAASRHHATIQGDGVGHFHLFDARSSNGTLLNGRVLTGGERLRDGDLVEIGGQQFCFRQSALEVGKRDDSASEHTQFLVSRDLVTVMVVDICDFTGLSRRIGETRIGGLVSDLFRTSGEVLDGNGCWAKKYIGDAVMAVWRHREPVLEPMHLALLLRIFAEFLLLSRDLVVRHALGEPIRMRMALNAGYAATGNMGSAGTADFTAMGDTVNKAFRLEGGAKALGADVLIAADMIGLIHPRLPAGSIPDSIDLPLKGYDAPEPVHVMSYAQAGALARAILASGRGD
ncbi:adenylate/guanylate cyclase domain-containing protein [Sandaracinobacteroides saxicola]|uniref:adenylate/guanylate cyclase domain-containing protein n=1 Tax=Sandaracinobacteroides saxicola TaxID=2759707 RepID=UPI001FB04C51|nr:adenylate/guanylate cyclase domain-containing protein [Sandaracinobacteroides saxicola]